MHTLHREWYVEYKGVNLSTSEIELQGNHSLTWGRIVVLSPSTH